MTFEWSEGLGAGYDAAKEVRASVFIEEQGFTVEGEFDEADAECLHLVARNGQGQPVATARLLKKGEDVYQIGRMAVLPACRGKGLGLLIMQHAVEEAARRNARLLCLNAQADKEGFYERAGFRSTGKKNFDEGHPHIWMERIL